MSNYSKLFEKPDKEKPEMRPIGGSFECQVCGVDVDDARYYPTESLLVWECPENHKSHIEGFDLM